MDKDKKQMRATNITFSNAKEVNKCEYDFSMTLKLVSEREQALCRYYEQVAMLRMVPSNYDKFKQEFTKEEAILCAKIRSMLPTLSDQSPLQTPFWIKLKEIIKTSLDRAQSLQLLSQRLFTRYEQILLCINNHMLQQSKIQCYAEVQSLLRFKNVEAIIHCTREAHKITLPISADPLPTSQQTKPILCKSLALRTKKYIRKDIKSAQNKIKKNNIIVKNKSQIQNKIKVHRYIKNIQQLMDTKIDLDKIKAEKKFLYRWLLQKNINVGAAINKYRDICHKKKYKTQNIEEQNIKRTTSKISNTIKHEKSKNRSPSINLPLFKPINSYTLRSISNKKFILKDSIKSSKTKYSASEKIIMEKIKQIIIS